MLLENFRPGVLARLGFGGERLAELNPSLVTLSISGFGHDGPEGGRAGYDQIAQGEAGLMSLTGSGPDDPQRVGVPIGDLLAGLYGVIGVLAGLVERAATRRGQLVRTSLLGSIVGVHAFQGTRWTVAGEVGHAQGNHHPSIAPVRTVSLRRRHRADRGRQRGSVEAVLCGVRHRCQHSRSGDNADRVAHRDQVIELVEKAFAATDAETLLVKLADAGIPAGKVRTLDEVYQWEQTRSQRLLIDVEHETLGTTTLPGSPLRFFLQTSDGEVETTKVTHRAPPVLNADEQVLLQWSGEPR